MAHPVGTPVATIGAFSYYGIRRRGSSNWSGYFWNDGSQTKEIVEFSQAFTPAYIGWMFYSPAAKAVNYFFSTDFLRLSTNLDELPP